MRTQHSGTARIVGALEHMTAPLRRDMPVEFNVHDFAAPQHKAAHRKGAYSTPRTGKLYAHMPERGTSRVSCYERELASDYQKTTRARLSEVQNLDYLCACRHERLLHNNSPKAEP